MNSKTNLGLKLLAILLFMAVMTIIMAIKLNTV